MSFTPTSSLPSNAYAYVTLPSGVITNMAGESYVGTAFSFNVPYAGHELLMWGYNSEGMLGVPSIGTAARSSPVQVPGTTWTKNATLRDSERVLITKNDGTLWAWGRNEFGELGQNEGVNAYRSSPVQIPGTTWDKISGGASAFVATKTDGTLWTWGTGNQGNLGLNQGYPGHRSSPTQIPGTWAYPLASQRGYHAGGLKES